MRDEGGRMKDEGGRMRDEGGRMREEGRRMNPQQRLGGVCVCVCVQTLSPALSLIREREYSFWASPQNPLAGVSKGNSCLTSIDQSHCSQP